MCVKYCLDTGWYAANYSMADPNYYGSQAGCSFVEEMCSNSTWGRYYCSPHTCGEICSHQCVGDRSAIGIKFYPYSICDIHFMDLGYCELSAYNNLPTYYQHVPGNASAGGSSEFADYCPLVDSYAGFSCFDGRVPDTLGFLELGENYTQSSACFDTLDTPGFGGGCFPKRH
jgi:hypothetical protein